MKSQFAPLIIATMLLISCSDRERLNPLDPQNPDTHGKPTGLTVSSNKKRVQLRWDLLDINTLSGYYLYRGVGFDQSLQRIDTLSSKEHNITDTVSEYDVIYRYAISAFTDNYESPKSEEESIVTGPFNYWITDFYTGMLTRISYDGGHLLDRIYLGWPVAIEYFPRDSCLWIANYYPHQLMKLNLKGEILNSQLLEMKPVDLALNPSNGHIFIVGLDNNALMEFDINGNRVKDIPTDILFNYNTTIAVDSSTGFVWIAVADSNIVLRIDPSENRELRMYDNLSRPTCIATLSSESNVWIGTDSGLVVINLENNIDTYLSNHKILDIDVNEKNKEVWMITYLSNDNSWFVYKIFKNENEWILNNIYDNEELHHLRKIRVNPGSDHPGVILYDNWDNKIIRLDPMGNIIGSYTEISSSIDITVEY